MDSPAVLLAETDHRILDLLPCILSDRIPQLSIEICTSTGDLCQKLKGSPYDIVAIGSVLIQHYFNIKKGQITYSLHVL